MVGWNFLRVEHNPHLPHTAPLPSLKDAKLIDTSIKGLEASQSSSKSKVKWINKTIIYAFYHSWTNWNQQIHHPLLQLPQMGRYIGRLRWRGTRARVINITVAGGTSCTKQKKLPWSFDFMSGDLWWNWNQPGEVLRLRQF